MNYTFNGFIFVLLVLFASVLVQEYNYSKYTLIKDRIISNTLTLNPIINPTSISNQFVFLPNIDLYEYVKRSSDDFLDYDVLRYNGPQSVYVERDVDVCVSDNDVTSSYHWTPATKVTKYTPDINRTIYNDIKLQNFYLDQSLFSNNSKLKTFKLDYKEIYRNFYRSDITEKKFVYTYIGDGWFYHMNKGNVTQYLRSREYGTNIFKTASSIIFRIIIFFIFHTMMYVNIGGSDGSVLTQSERINMLMSNCNPYDVRFKYRYFLPKHKVSILAYKEKDRLTLKEISGFTFGRIVEGARTIEKMFDEYPEGFDPSMLLTLKIVTQILFLSITFYSFRGNRYKLHWFIAFAGALVMAIRMILWGKTRMFSFAISILFFSILGYLIH